MEFIKVIFYSLHLQSSLFDLTYIANRNNLLTDQLGTLGPVTDEGMWSSGCANQPFGLSELLKCSVSAFSPVAAVPLLCLLWVTEGDRGHKDIHFSQMSWKSKHQKCKEACSVCTVGNSSPSLPGECTRAGWSVLGWGARSKNYKIPDREGFAFLLVFISVFCKAYTSIFAFKYSLIFTCLKGYYNGLSKVSSPH